MPGNDNLQVDPSQLDAARKAGYSDDEILQHLAQKRGTDFSQALKAGYSSSEVLEHLSSLFQTPEAKAASAAGATPPQEQAKTDLKAIPKFTPEVSGVDEEGNMIPSDKVNAPSPLNADATSILGSTKAAKGLKGAAFALGLGGPAGEAVEAVKGAQAAKTSRVMEPVIAGAAENMDRIKAAEEAAETTSKEKSAQILAQEKAAADQAAQQQSLAKNSSKVANLASKATNDGVKVDVLRGMQDYVKNLEPAAQDDFLENVQPKLTELLKKYNPEKGGLLDPRSALKFRQAAYDMLKEDPELAEYADEMHKAITDPLHDAMSDYKGFKAASSRIPVGTDPLKSSKLGSVAKTAVSSADDVAKVVAQQENKAPTAAVEKPALPEDAPEPPPTDGSSLKSKIMANPVVKWAKQNPKTAIALAGGGSLGTALLKDFLKWGADSFVP